MKKVFTLLLAIAVCAWYTSCDTDEVFNADEQLDIDLQLIDQFLADNNLIAEIDQDSQIRYIISQAGDGDNAAFGNSVEVHYRGTLLDGTEFDNSEGRGPFTFVLGRGDVIQGWDVIYQNFNVGTQAVFFIPSGLAYGNSRGPANNLPLNAVLVFETTVLDIR